MSGETLSEKDVIKKLDSMKAALYKQRIKDLAKVYGSVRALGRALHIDHAYLQRLCNGEKKSPSEVVLRKLGLL